MTKQEEIKDGLIKLYQDGRLTPTNALFFMEKRGVVIKVDRKLPERMFIEGYGYLQEHSAQALLDKAGCVAVESLIETT